jgi:xanthine dehydrogenase iron-sulfur cluster and FAD-binding subunit A
MRSSAAYRMQVAQNLLQRFYQETTGGDVVQVYRYGR